MKSNIGNLDRTARIGVGALLIGLAFAEAIGAWGYIGVVPLATGLFGICPAYSLMEYAAIQSGIVEANPQPIAGPTA